jgi:hypothetical protein
VDVVGFDIWTAWLMNILFLVFGHDTIGPKLGTVNHLGDKRSWFGFLGASNVKLATVGNKRISRTF